MGQTIYFKGAETWAAVQRDAALMNGNPYAHWERRGISFASGAMECRPVSWGAVACIRLLSTVGIYAAAAGLLDDVRDFGPVPDSGRRG